MNNSRFLFSASLAAVLLVVSVFPAFAVTYNPGVVVGNYVKYGNFVGVGPGVEYFNEYDWLKLDVIAVSVNDVTLLSTGQFKNGTAIPGNGSVSTWNVASGTEDGIPKTQGPIIAANLNQNDAIPPPDTYYVNATEDLSYLNIVRSVNLLNVTISTPDYNSTLTYAYDRLSGMLLETATQTTQTQPQLTTTAFSYEIIETNIFGPASSPTPSPSIPEIPGLTLEILVLLAIASFLLLGILRKRAQQTSNIRY